MRRSSISAGGCIAGNPALTIPDIAQQLSFDLPAKTALGRDDFFVAPSNALAVAMIGQPSWPGGKLTLTGPSGSGKTHLTHVWATDAQARIISACDVQSADVPDLANGPVAVEDVPTIAQDTQAQTALFHLHNLVLANGHSLLLTGVNPPKTWGMSLPDLQSRIEGAQNAVLDPPDDALLAAVLAKLFADRQVVPKPDVIPYLIRHMDRSFEAAQTLVAHLDQVALAEGRRLTRNLAARVLNSGTASS